MGLLRPSSAAVIFHVYRRSPTIYEDRGSLSYSELSQIFPFNATCMGLLRPSSATVIFHVYRRSPTIYKDGGLLLYSELSQNFPFNATCIHDVGSFMVIILHVN